MMFARTPVSRCEINCTPCPAQGPDGFSIADRGGYEINCTNLPSLVRQFVDNSLSPNTWRAYTSDIGVFVRWGGRLPASPSLVAEFLAAHARSHAASTLSRYLAAISKVHRIRSLPDPTASELVRSTLRGIRRSGLGLAPAPSPSHWCEKTSFRCLMRWARRLPIVAIAYSCC
jgi:hypothetical protein